ncbi:acyltransferase [Paeniclostridium sordellii]|uniref:acyltransferase family protein n=1 Tax=Paraclostridium sordellii TaxID=1505 RepID=UPI00214A7AB2|nr:acyltransferase [Paeniclostridium sordellii]MCR1849934.1 acyltransferase [Paeniclostridium sordellii]
MKSVKLNKLNHISILRNIALICVVLGNAGCIYAGKWNFTVVNSDSKLLKYITDYIYSFHMPLFVFISGYIYNHSKETLYKYNSIKDFIIGKWKRLIIPYILTGIVFMIPLQTFFSVYEDKESFIVDKAIKYIILAQRPGHLWYLLMLFNLFIIFTIIEERLNRNSVVFNLVILEIISMISIKLPNTYYISSAFYYLIYFYIGYILCRNVHRVKRTLINNSKKYLIANILLFNINYILINYIKVYGILTKLVILFLNSIIAILAIICLFTYTLKLADNRYMLNKIIKNKNYKLINKHNFKIYLLHQPIMLSIISMMKRVDIMPEAFYLVLFLVSLIISILISTGMELFRYNLLRLRNGSLKQLNI